MNLFLCYSPLLGSITFYVLFLLALIFFYFYFFSIQLFIFLDLFLALYQMSTNKITQQIFVLVLCILYILSNLIPLNCFPIFFLRKNFTFRKKFRYNFSLFLGYNHHNPSLIYRSVSYLYIKM